MEVARVIIKEPAQSPEATSLSFIVCTCAEGTFVTTHTDSCRIDEIEIGPKTGAAGMARNMAVNDRGSVINPNLVEGQVHGRVTQGAGKVFGEQPPYDSATVRRGAALWRDVKHAAVIFTDQVGD